MRGGGGGSARVVVDDRMGGVDGSCVGGGYIMGWVEVK